MALYANATSHHAQLVTTIGCSPGKLATGALARLIPSSVALPP